MANSVITADQTWLRRIQDLIAEIRSWDEWQEEPLKTMRSSAGGLAAGSLALYCYSIYVRRFMLIMCDVLSKVPDADNRFWRLAINLYDEFGANVGFSMAHSKLIEGARQRPSEIPQEVWDACASEMRGLEEDLVCEFQTLRWPLNLFALGPATESISDLFLEPLETWGSEVLKGLPGVQSYFEVHRPDVEYEHQLEISRVLAEELANMPEEKAMAYFDEGKSVAVRVARRHLYAVSLCWRVSAERDSAMSYLSTSRK